jgi:hypothetical protein
MDTTNTPPEATTASHPTDANTAALVAEAATEMATAVDDDLDASAAAVADAQFENASDFLFLDQTI